MTLSEVRELKHSLLERPAPTRATEEAPRRGDAVELSGRKERIDFSNVRNVRTAAMLPLMDAGVQLAVAAALGAVAAGAPGATVSIAGSLAWHNVKITYDVDAAGIHGEGTLGGLKLREGIALSGGPAGATIDSSVGDSAITAQAHMHGEMLHTDGSLGTVPLHLTICQGEEPGSTRIRGMLKGSEIAEDVSIAMLPHQDPNEPARMRMFAEGHVGHRKLERTYDITATDDGFTIDASGRLGRGNPTDLHIELHLAR